MTTPQRGFKVWVRQAIRERPGHSSEEYARTYLDENPDGSNSKNPVWSLKTTLDKEYREGRMPGIVAKRVDGKFCYFPADYQPGTKTQPDNGLRIEVMVPPDAARRVSDLLEIEEFRSPSEAVVWLLQEGIKAKQPALDRIAAELQEIRRRKETARGLL